MLSSIFAFIGGTLAGSFLNVLAVRYDPDRFLLKADSWRGRSRCPHCGTTLRWFELIPLASFLVQRGRCRTCAARISFQYPLVEIVTGLVFVAVLAHPMFELWGVSDMVLSALWILVFLVLLLTALIDLRTAIIPDESNIALLALGALIAWHTAGNFSITEGSFLAPYAPLFGIRENIVVNRLFAAFVALAFFGGLVALTRGRGMGMGDVKLGGVLGVVFGWPDVAGIVLVAFVLGAAVGLAAIALHRKTIRGALPFGPFLAAASLIVFVWGGALLGAYFALFPLP
jgi:leader peptidase (prepilin peptidase)/N-methyltransferase